MLATEIDRIGRCVRDVLNFYDEAASMEVRLICRTQGFDTEDAVRRLVPEVFASVATREGELIVERTNAGLRRARAFGKTIGRPRGASTETDGVGRYGRTQRT